MRKIRTCDSAQLNTGVSKCPLVMENMKGAIIVAPGTKLPTDLTADKLEELAHADLANRVYGIGNFVEYAKNGGEVQTSALGYGPEEATGVSARKDTFTLNKFYPELDAALTAAMNKAWDVYFYDANGRLFGINDGTDTLAGYPMSGIYADSTPFNTSGAKATMTVTFCHEDAKIAKERFDYVKLDFNPARLLLGLVAVDFKPLDDKGNDYKLYEKVGGYDVTAIYGPLMVTAGADVVDGATAVTYNATTKTLTVTAAAGVAVRLKAASVLFENGIKGIEQV